MMARSVCPFCQKAPISQQELRGPSGGIRAASLTVCRRCGKFEITDEAAVNARTLNDGQRSLLSGLTRNATERGDVMTLDTESLDKLVDTTPVPQPLEQVDLVLEYLAARGVRRVGLGYELDYPIAFAHGMSDFIRILSMMVDDGLIHPPNEWEPIAYELTLKGHRLLEERRKAKRVELSTTGWEAVDRVVGEMRKRLQEATNEVQAQSIGHLCGQVLVALAQAVHDPQKHPTMDGKEASPTDTKRRLEAFISATLDGSSRAEERKIARDAIAFAHDVVKFAENVKHDQRTTPMAAAICAEATTAVVSIVRVISARVKSNE